MDEEWLAAQEYKQRIDAKKERELMARYTRRIIQLCDEMYTGNVSHHKATIKGNAEAVLKYLEEEK